MKKANYSIAMLAISILATASCSTNSNSADTSNIVNAEIVEENYSITEPEINTDTLKSSEETLIDESFVFESQNAEQDEKAEQKSVDTKSKAPADSIS